jgi:pimeloyl-ACP methyl ester carboxylesterase
LKPVLPWRGLVALLWLLGPLTSLAATSPETTAPSLQKEARALVVMLHGLGRSNKAMWYLESKFSEAGFEVVRVGYKSVNQSPDQILASVSEQIGSCCLQSEQTVNFVGHSLGGLMIRAYLQEHEIRTLGRVVLMGTPNQGTELVDRYRDRWWLQLLGETALALGTGEGSFPRSLDPPYYPVGVIAGELKSTLNDKVLPGRDDGLVPVESTRIDGMADFIVIETGHSSMRYNEEVAQQAIAFLQEGAFSKPH